MKKILVSLAAGSALAAVPAMAQDAGPAQSFDGFHVEGLAGYDIAKAGSSVDDIRITCVLSDLGTGNQATFAEHLTYLDGKASLLVNLHARRLATEGSVKRGAILDHRNAT